MKKNFYVYNSGKITPIKYDHSPYHKFLANTFTLCFGRHDMIVNDYIFPTEVNPYDFKSLDKIATLKLKNCSPDHQVIVYVTGLKSALLSVVNVCRRLGLPLIFIHYNAKLGGYANAQLMGDFKLTDFAE